MIVRKLSRVSARGNEGSSYDSCIYKSAARLRELAYQERKGDGASVRRFWKTDARSGGDTCAWKGGDGELLGLQGCDSKRKSYMETKGAKYLIRDP